MGRSGDNPHGEGAPEGGWVPRRDRGGEPPPPGIPRALDADLRARMVNDLEADRQRGQSPAGETTAESGEQPGGDSPPGGGTMGSGEVTRQTIADAARLGWKPVAGHWIRDLDDEEWESFEQGILENTSTGQGLEDLYLSGDDPAQPSADNVGGDTSAPEEN